MGEATKHNIVRFTRDMTLVWPCRQGDFLLWFRYGSPIARPHAVQCRDLWEMKSGYRVTVTNRLEDLPSWFQLHPFEVCDRFAYKLMPRFEKGDYPDQPLDGPNLWRLNSGDRVAWVGTDRPDRRSTEGILAVLECIDCALAVGEGEKGGIEEFVGFGQPTGSELKGEDLLRCRKAVEVVSRLGLPRVWGAEWKLGG